MRFVLVLLALAACHRAPTGSTPANKAPAPDYRATADDELGFLPAGSDLVLGVNMRALRASAMWNSFGPQIAALGREFDKLGGNCGKNPLDTLERVTMALNVLPNGGVRGVVVARGVDTSRALDCVVQETKKNGGTAVLDRGVVVASNPSRPNQQMAAAVVGPATFVMQMDTTVSYDSMTKLLASGTPLRSSQAFMALYQRREGNAAVWGMANGNAAIFNELEREGMRPKSIDGTITVTDRFVIALRLTMTSPDQAGKVGAELDKVKGPAANFVQKFDSQIQGDMVAVNVVFTEAQLRQGLAMVFGPMGP